MCASFLLKFRAIPIIPLLLCCTISCFPQQMKPWGNDFKWGHILESCIWDERLDTISNLEPCTVPFPVCIQFSVPLSSSLIIFLVSLGLIVFTSAIRVFCIILTSTYSISFLLLTGALLKSSNALHIQPCCRKHCFKTSKCLILSLCIWKGAKWQ